MTGYGEQKLAEVVGAKGLQVTLRQATIVSIQAGPPRTATIDYGDAGSNAGAGMLDSIGNIPVGAGVWVAMLGGGRALVLGSTGQSDIIFPNNGGQMIRSSDNAGEIIVDSAGGNMALRTTGTLHLQPDVNLILEAVSATMNGNDMYASGVTDQALTLSSLSHTAATTRVPTGSVALTSVPYARIVTVTAAALVSSGVTCEYDFYIRRASVSWKRARRSSTNISVNVSASELLPANTAKTYDTSLYLVTPTTTTSFGGDSTLNYLCVSWVRAGV